MTDQLAPNFGERSIGTYLTALSSGAPTPGGGSAAGLAGALGCSLGEMVCHLTRARSETDELATLATRFAETAATLLQLAERDEHVFARYRVAIGLPRASDEEKAQRRAAIEQALVSAAEVPLAMIETGLIAIGDLRRTGEIGSPHAIGDVMTGGYLVQAMILGSLENLEANASVMKLPENRERFDRAARLANLQAASEFDALQSAVRARRG